MNSTLGSVVPLAMFYFAFLQSALEPLHALTFCLAKLTISSGYCSLRNAFSAKSRKDLMLWKYLFRLIKFWNVWGNTNKSKHWQTKSYDFSSYWLLLAHSGSSNVGFQGLGIIALLVETANFHLQKSKFNCRNSEARSANCKIDLELDTFETLESNWLLKLAGLNFRFWLFHLAEILYSAQEQDAIRTPAEKGSLLLFCSRAENLDNTRTDAVKLFGINEEDVAPYLIFVIFFTQAKFLENKIYQS